MVVIDTDVFVLAFAFHRDSRQAANSQFLEVVRTHESAITIYSGWGSCHSTCRQSDWPNGVAGCKTTLDWLSSIQPRPIVQPMNFSTPTWWKARCKGCPAILPPIWTA